MNARDIIEAATELRVADHVCMNCDGLPINERRGCYSQGMHLTGADVMSLAAELLLMEAVCEAANPHCQVMDRGAFETECRSCISGAAQFAMCVKYAALAAYRDKEENR